MSLTEEQRAANVAATRMFPIIGGRRIPWSLIEPFEGQAMANHGGQSLGRLAERGGLSKAEAYAVVAGLSIHDVIQQRGGVSKAAALWDGWVEARVGLLARIAELEAALEREREDHARTAWTAGNRSDRCYPMLVRLEYADSDGTFHLSDWCLYKSKQTTLPIEDYRIRLGADDAPAWTDDARAVADQARKEAGDDAT